MIRHYRRAGAEFPACGQDNDGDEYTSYQPDVTCGGCMLLIDKPPPIIHKLERGPDGLLRRPRLPPIDDSD